jgi:hypothetical protein
MLAGCGGGSGGSSQTAAITAANAFINTLPNFQPIQAASGNYSSATNKVKVIAGSAATNMFPVDGTGTAAIFWGGGHLVLDGSGNIIVSDRGALRKVTQAGVVTTLSALSVNFVAFDGIAIDGAGNIYGSGPALQLVSKSPVTWGASVNELTASGAIRNIATNWETSTTDSAVGMGGLAVDGSGNLYQTDGANNRIVKFTSAGVMSVFAGSGANGSHDGAGTEATFNNPTDLAIDTNGNLFVIDSGNSLIRKIAPDGTVSTFVKNQGGYSPIAVDTQGNIYTVRSTSFILRTDKNGSTTTFPVSGISDNITTLAADGNGNLYAGTRGFGAQILKISF